MSESNLLELMLGLTAGAVGVILIVIGLPLCAAVFGRALLRSYRQRRLFRSTTSAIVVTSVVALLGGGLWAFAVSTAPGVYDQPLSMLAMTFMPFTVSFAALALIAQHFTTPSRRRSESRAAGLVR
ncbi:hypothetical protein ACFSBZ_03055 [Amnibacterium flavum]|uniref:Uncharacterized protein n=1 Tax=Amnibacterium flavum TaxID=2173173 RepID=A0A2V1HPN2_9MICO|nr:hypothetical protein [Amnibacterium flavum]PVZ94498.1 hypothetical protein DDQ50_12405 [Amnibacterium flavum]